jgi:hypothetical protein
MTFLRLSSPPDWSDTWPMAHESSRFHEHPAPSRSASRDRFPAPWSVDEQSKCFIVYDANSQPLVYVYYEDELSRRSAAKLLSRDEAHRIAFNTAKLPDLLQNPQGLSRERVFAICERVAELQATLHDAVKDRRLSPGEASARVEAIMSEDAVLRAMFDVGYLSPNTPPDDEES